MRSNQLIHVVSAHAEGEVGDVIVGGVPAPPGATLWEQSRWIAKDQQLRRLLLNEPRGGVFRHINLLVPAKDPQAAMGWIIMEPEDTPPMSGSNSICVATVLLETGMVPMQEGANALILEAPGGLVRAVAQCHGGKAVSVQVTNLPSFVCALDAPLEVPGIGTVRVDTAFGGDSFVLVDARDFGFALVPDEARDLAALGAKITNAANEQLDFNHPTLPDWRHFSFCQLTLPTERVDGVLVGKNTVSIKPGKLDRSPCGTGCSARMAVLHARGELAAGDRFVGRSIIGSRFDCRIEAETRVGDVRAIVPSIEGQAWITGTHQHMVDPDDPWPTGYRLSDTWPVL